MADLSLDFRYMDTNDCDFSTQPCSRILYFQEEPRMKFSLRALLVVLTLFIYSTAQDPMPANPAVLLRVGQDQKKATKINDAIFQAIGFGNTFMVTTEAGNVIIDTSMPFNATLHKRLLTAESAGPIKYI